MVSLRQARFSQINHDACSCVASWVVAAVGNCAGFAGRINSRICTGSDRASDARQCWTHQAGRHQRAPLDLDDLPAGLRQATADQLDGPSALLGRCGTGCSAPAAPPCSAGRATPTARRPRGSGPTVPASHVSMLRWLWPWITSSAPCSAKTCCSASASFSASRRRGLARQRGMVDHHQAEQAGVAGARRERRPAAPAAARRPVPRPWPAASARRS